MPKRRLIFPALVFLSLIVGLASGCNGAGEGHTAMAPLDQMPPEVQSAPPVVREAYQFAAANPGVMKQIPCYCGCGAMGHTSNYACYVADADAKGVITYDTHALGCSICVDITQDTMRLLKEGKSIPEIRAYIDSTYAKYGPSNMP